MTYGLVQRWCGWDSPHGLHDFGFDSRCTGIPEPEKLVPVLLTPVSVFGAVGTCLNHPDIDIPKCSHCGDPLQSCYGLSDATSSWSDCNRAEGHIFRVDDIPSDNPERVQILVWVPESELNKLNKEYR